MAVTDNWSSGQTFTAADEDNVGRAINGSGWLQPCHYATTGSETFTLSAGSVTTINGTTIDGGTVAVGDRILVKDAPATSGTGSAFSSQPGNGVYSVTGVSSNMTLLRVYEMSASPSPTYYPGGWMVAVMGGSVNAGLTFIVKTPNNPAVTFTYGTNSIAWAANGYGVGTGLTLTGSILGLSSATQTSLGLANSAVQSAGTALTKSGSSLAVSPMATGQIIYGSAGTPTIGSISGDIALSAAGAATVNNNAITYAKVQQMAAQTLLGNNTGSTATPTAVPMTSVGTASSVATTTSWGGLVASSYATAISSVTTSGGTTALTLASAGFLQFVGTANQTVVLPQGTTMYSGVVYTITNRSTGTLTVQTYGGATLQTMVAGSQAVITCTGVATSPGTWDVSYTIAGLAGTLTGVSVASSNGFAGSSSGGPTPTLTISTSVTGLLKGNGTAVSAAVSGTDYAPPTATTSILKGNGSGGFVGAVSGTDYAPKTPSGSNALASNGAGAFQTATLNMVATPTANYSLGGYLLNNLGTPVSSADAVTKGYVDAAVQGISSKYSAVAATNTETLTIGSGSVTQITGTTVDTYSPAIGDYVLVMNAPASTGAASGTTLSTQPANGLYQVTANTTNLTVTRASAMSGSSDSPAGAYVFVESGATWASGGFIVTTPVGSATFTYGSGSVGFTQFTGAGEITAGYGLTKSGNTLSIALTAGTAISITNNSTTIGVANGSIGTTQLSATGTKDATTYHRGDNTWANLASAVSATLTAGTAISISSGTISVATGSINLSLLSATGTPSSSTFLRGDNTWSTVGSVLSGISLSSLAAPTAAIGWGGYGITGLANPTNPQDAATKAYVDTTGYHPACRYGTTGTETFTISAGTVTTISGTTIDGGSPNVNDRILIKDAPASSGTGSILSSNPANGIYIVTGNSTNLSVSRVTDMSAGGVMTVPAGVMVEVTSGTSNAATSWKVSSPTNPGGSFTYGSTAITWTPDVNTGSGLVRLGNTISIASMSTGQIIYGNAGVPTIGALNGNATISSTGALTIGNGVISAAMLNTSGTASATSFLAGNMAWTTLNQAAVPDVVSTSSAASLTLGTTTSIYEYTGTSTATWTLPSASGKTGVGLTVVNNTGYVVTVAPAGTDNINGTNASITVGGAASPSAVTLVNDGSGWVTVNTYGKGTVSSVSVVSANGLAGSVATNTSTPAITLSTTVTGLLKGNGTAIAAAVSGTDYAPATTGTAILKASSGGFANAVAGTDYAPATSGTSLLYGSGSGGFSSATVGTGLSFTTGTLAIDSTVVTTLTGTQALTNKNLTSGTNTFPTFNQNTTGNAATATTASACSGNAATATALATARNIAGVSFNGTASIALPYDLSLMGFGAATTRATGTGDNPMGLALQRACTLTSVTFRCATADASGNLVVQLNRNGSAISATSTTIAAASQVAGGTTTFSQACSAGDIITIDVTAVGTTPGAGLIADITGSF